MDNATTTINIVSIFIQSSVTAVGAFLGALFAYLFFKRGEKYKRKLEWKKTYKNEHAYLERYFYELYTIITDNKKVVETIIDSYGKKEIEMGKTEDLPIREDSSMKIEDQLFINKVETYLNIGLKKLNRWQIGLGKVQDKLNEDLLDGDGDRRQRAENNLDKFTQELKMLVKYYNYYIDVIDDLMLENKFLLKKYKKWKYDKQVLKETYKDRKKDINKEREYQETKVENPLLEEQAEKLKKHGLDPEINE